MPEHCVASRNMRFAEYRPCAQPPVASSAVSAVKARLLDAQRRSQRQPHHHSAKQATHSSILEALKFKKNAILMKTVAISSKILELLRRGSLSLRSDPVVARSVLYYFTTIEHDFSPIRPLPFQRKTRRLPIVAACGWSIWRRFCTQFDTQVSSASVMTSLFCCPAAFTCF